MSVMEVRTFKDIQDAILRRGKIEDTTSNRNDLKEFINTSYARIGREEPYKWAGETLPIRLRGKYETGTLTATKDSDQVTGDSTVWAENSHRFSRMKITGSNTAYRILRIGSTTTATLDQPWVGTTAASLTYQIYRDEYGLFPDFQGMRRFRIQGQSAYPLPISPEKMDQLRDAKPFYAGVPKYYTVFGSAIYTEKVWSTFNLNHDFWEDSLDSAPRNPCLVVWPAIHTTDTMALIRYTKVLPPLSEDDDEPLMPVGDRVVLVWGTLCERFLANRDISTKREWESSYKDCKKKMSGDLETTDDELIMQVDATSYSRRTFDEDETLA